MYADDTELLLGTKGLDQLIIAAFTVNNMAIQYCDGNDLMVDQTKRSS